MLTSTVESNIPVLAHTPSLLPTIGTDNSPARESSAGAIAGTLVEVVLVVVVAVLVVLLVVLVLRRGQKKQLHAVNTEERVLDNPVYAGTLSHSFRITCTFQFLHTVVNFPLQC